MQMTSDDDKRQHGIAAPHHRINHVFSPACISDSLDNVTLRCSFMLHWSPIVHLRGVGLPVYAIQPDSSTSSKPSEGMDCLGSYSSVMIPGRTGQHHNTWDWTCGRTREKAFLTAWFWNKADITSLGDVERIHTGSIFLFCGWVSKVSEGVRVPQNNTSTPLLCFCSESAVVMIIIKVPYIKCF